MTELIKTVAQMVMPRLDGVFLEDPSYRKEIEALVREGLGGFILFRGDIESTPRRLQELQKQAEIPLFITSDVERGLGQQLTGGTRFPSQRAVASAIKTRSKKDMKLLEEMLNAVRIETRGAGIQGVFSPVVDVNSNPCNPIICTRSFGETAEVVERFARYYITGLQKAVHGRMDLLACAKHFPGHGDTDQDSHSVLPVISADKPRLNSLDLPPFREAVKDGVGMIMVAHLMVPALDPGKPTTFSKKTITALLREGMAFDGLIVSDALDMLALAGQYSQEEIAVRTVESGMDILLHPRDARVTINAVAAAVEEGRITVQRIRESVDRIRGAKMRLGLFNAPESAGAGKIDYEKHRAIARELSRKALKIVSGNKKLLPFKSAAPACFLIDDDAAGRGKIFLRTLQAKAVSFSGTVLTPDAELAFEHVQERVAGADWTVIPIVSKISASKGYSGISPKLAETAHRIIDAAKTAKRPSVVISFDSPYILDQFPEADICIAGYDWMNEIQEAAAEMLIEKQ